MRTPCLLTSEQSTLFIHLPPQSRCGSCPAMPWSDFSAPHGFHVPACILRVGMPPKGRLAALIKGFMAVHACALSQCCCPRSSWPLLSPKSLTGGHACACSELCEDLWAPEVYGLLRHRARGASWSPSHCSVRIPNVGNLTGALAPLAHGGEGLYAGLLRRLAQHACGCILCRRSRWMRWLRAGSSNITGDSSVHALPGQAGLLPGCRHNHKCMQLRCRVYLRPPCKPEAR